MGLLEYVSLKAGCEYLSDLSAKVLKKNFPPKLLSALYSVEAAQWPCEEWAEAASYMTGRPITAGDPQEYREKTICTLEEHRRVHAILSSCKAMAARGEMKKIDGGSKRSRRTPSNSEGRSARSALKRTY